MSQRKQKRTVAANAASARPAPTATRVDTAHVREVEPPAKETPALPCAAELSTASVHQVRSQAAQLATHLQRQQAAIDHREAELNARMAAIENQVRSARMWLTERQSDLSKQKSELDRREQELAEREAQLGREPKSGRKKTNSRANTTGDDFDLAERKAELDRRQAELDAVALRMVDQLEAGEKVDQVDKAMRGLETRRENLERAEKLLAAGQQDLELERQHLAEERLRFAQQVQADRQKLADDQQRAAGELDQRRHDLKRQSDEFAARQDVLGRMRSDIARSQQEALETRLATEELWTRLCGTMAPATLTQSLAQIRLKLAEEHRLTRSELAQQKAEVQMLSVRLAEQHAKLTNQREELQAWATGRQTDLEKQAALLIAQQLQVENERHDFKSAREEWRNERFRLQQEIRRLLRQVDTTGSKAA